MYKLNDLEKSNLEQYRGKTFVAKFGGDELYNKHFDSNIEDVVFLRKHDVYIVIDRKSVV